MRFQNLRFWFDPRLITELVRRRGFQRAQQIEEHGRERQWFLLCGRAEKERLLDPTPATLNKLMPPANTSWADPFLWRHQQQWFVFCEQWRTDQPHGHIAVIPLADDGRPAAAAQPVLTLGYHLSYPFLFEHEGTLYMLPEAAGGNAVDVYRCDEFPHRWCQCATLMRNLRYADATLLEHGGSWWLFLTIRDGPFGLNHDLFLFRADSPLTDRWEAHPGNPVVRGFTRARPAGRVFELGGQLLRPSQDCLVRYGHGLNINQILQLDRKRYRERLARKVAPDWEAGIRANHHIDWRDGLLVMDAQRLLPLSPPGDGPA